jgi:IS5 family transposase
MFACPATDDFFRARLDHMIDLRQPLVVLASHMPWQALEARVSQAFSGRAHTGEPLPDLDLFGEQVQRSTRQSNAGRPRVPLRVMIALLYLKHAFNLSDEAVVERWSETPRWQFFSGMAYYEERLPCDATTLVKFRRLLGEEGCEELLAQTINQAVNMKLIPVAALATVVVDSTVQEKAIAHPNDARLLEVARRKLVQAAKEVGVELKQSFAKEGKTLRFKAGRYAHARQFKRLRKTVKRQRTIVAGLCREIARKAQAAGLALGERTQEALGKAAQIVAQAARRKSDPNTPESNIPKLYAWHAPEVVCMAKGKSRTPYEFGAKVVIAMTLQHNLIVGARAFEGNPYDGHTLREQLEQAGILMQDTGMRPTTAYVDLGYRGVDADNPGIALKHRGRAKSLTPQEWKLLKRRQAIEPIIGHLKGDHGMDRCHLKGAQGDRLHAVLCAAGYNLRWLLRMIAKKGVAFLLQLYLRLCSGLAHVAALSGNWPRMLQKLVPTAHLTINTRLLRWAVD